LGQDWPGPDWLKKIMNPLKKSPYPEALDDVLRKGLEMPFCVKLRDHMLEPRNPENSQCFSSGPYWDAWREVMHKRFEARPEPESEQVKQLNKSLRNLFDCLTSDGTEVIYIPKPLTRDELKERYERRLTAYNNLVKTKKRKIREEEEKAKAELAKEKEQWLDPIAKELLKTDPDFLQKNNGRLETFKM
jgi:arsenate reductase-like glutaredoxin family protein